MVSSACGGYISVPLPLEGGGRVGVKAETISEKEEFCDGSNE